MIFKRAVQRYGITPEPETPYQRAGQLWDERIGAARVQAKNWRLMAFGCLGLTAALSGGLLWQSLQSRVVPYVVAVDRLGEARAVDPAVKDYQPTDPQIAWFLSHFIQQVRSISLDPVIMRDAWLSAYDFTTKRGALTLNEYARATDPFGQLGTRTVSVQVTSVVRASATSFQVKWVETAYERGNQAGTSHWTAILTVTMAPPSNADTLRKNPLGLYVDAIDWSRELDPASAAPATATAAATLRASVPAPLVAAAPASNSIPTMETNP
ncbi:conjugal transfer protein TrbF [Sphingobium subterraneum]|uniref:Type IV secretion system protein VirB5 n=1 Tax=Sphingobium subterraneum TaxID=627688 RepID=A0A841J3M3_9SPHN|nr:conjugal transfer protein TrbF [Sphingobium subterraneum]MBB6125384.1 type IV secretion system protein VirB5 [Sphingobium subterraneum]